MKNRQRHARFGTEAAKDILAATLVARYRKRARQARTAWRHVPVTLYMPAVIIERAGDGNLALKAVQTCTDPEHHTYIDGYTCPGCAATHSLTLSYVHHIPPRRKRR